MSESDICNWFPVAGALLSKGRGVLHMKNRKVPLAETKRYKWPVAFNHDNVQALCNVEFNETLF